MEIEEVSESGGTYYMLHSDYLADTWLLTWNPKRYSEQDAQYNLDEMNNEISQIGFAISKWSCGVTKRIKKGDSVYLIRLGEEPRGIIAAGLALSDVFTGTHWDESRREKGVKANRIYVQFLEIRLAEDKMLPITKLKEQFPDIHWSSQSSGILIPAKVSMKLNQLWRTKDKE